MLDTQYSGTYLVFIADTTGTDYRGVLDHFRGSVYSKATVGTTERVLIIEGVLEYPDYKGACPRIS